MERQVHVYCEVPGIRLEGIESDARRGHAPNRSARHVRDVVVISPRASYENAKHRLPERSAETVPRLCSSEHSVMVFGSARSGRSYF